MVVLASDMVGGDDPILRERRRKNEIFFMQLTVDYGNAKLESKKLYHYHGSCMDYIM
jgi:hypothetical protein